MGMREGREKGNLAIKRVGCLNDFARLEQAKIDLLNCHQMPPLAQISGLVDRAEATLSNFTQNTIPSCQDCSRLERSARNRNRGTRDNLERRGRDNLHGCYWRGRRHSLSERGEWSLTGRTGCRVFSIRRPA